MSELGLDGDGKWFLSKAVETISDKLKVSTDDIRLFKYNGEGRNYSAEFAVFSEGYNGLMINAYTNSFSETKIGLSFWQNKNLEEVIK